MLKGWCSVGTLADSLFVYMHMGGCRGGTLHLLCCHLALWPTLIPCYQRFHLRNSDD